MNAAAKRSALRLIPNGVYIMTARSANQYGAATVTWISQASFRPPLVMAAVRPQSHVFKCLEESGAAAIHVLDRAQRDLAQKFFSPTVVRDGTINGEPFSDGVTSVPILTSARAYLECLVRHILRDHGDHAVVVMEVIEAVHQQDIHPLLIAESPWQYGG
jgi:flavin reductase (DIM6/NTAB) family NADH-FMN oxidoreductase RutF